MKISIITVTYNAEDLIEQTMLSVASQDYPNVEHLVIDGSSTDQTLKIVQQHSSGKTRCISEPDQGIYDAMNKAIRLATGDWLNFLNAGDTFCSPQTLSLAAKELATDADFVYGNRNRISETGKSTFEAARKIEDTMLREAVFHQSLFNRRQALNEGYSREYSLASDYELIVRSYKQGKKFKKIDLTICNFLEGGTSRQHFNVTHLETMKILYLNQDKENQWRESDFYQHFASNNVGFFLNSKLQKFRRSLPGFRIKAKNNSDGNVVFTANKHNRETEAFLNRLNQPFSALNPEGRKARLLRVARQIKAKMLNKAVPQKSPQKSTLGSISHQATHGKTQTNSKRLQHSNGSELSEMENEDNPRITIATVSYNAEQEIEPTLQSVSEQTYRNLEYVVIDGASTDSTISLIEKYRPNIDQLLVEPDDGIYEAMNKAIALCKGEYLLFMNAGDSFCSENTVTELAKNIQERPDVVYGNRYYVEEKGSRQLQQSKPIDTVFQRMPYCHQAALTKIDSLRQHPFNTTYKYAADYDQVVQIYRAGLSFKKIDLAVCNFTAGGKSESGIRPYLEVLKIQFDNCPDLPTIKDSAYFRAFKNNVETLLDI